MYLLFMFFIIPGAFFAVSLAGRIPFLTMTAAVGVIGVFVIVVNIMQSKFNNRLPRFLKTWKWLPKCLRSLEPMDKVVKKLMSVFSKCCHCKKCDPPKEDDDDVDMYENEMTMEEEDADEFDDECGILGNTFICCRTKSNDSKLEDEGFVDESEKTDLMSTKKPGYEKTDWTSTCKHGDVVHFQPENKIFRGVLGMPINSLAVQNNSSDSVGQKKSLDYHTQELCSQMPLLYLVSEV